MANKKFYYHKKNKPKVQETSNDNLAAFYTEEQLFKTLEELGISENTRRLLSGARISIAADIARRTEKDLYKVQGFNKKMLFEVKDALKANGMELRAEAAPAQDKNKKPQQNDGKQKGGQDKNKKQRPEQSDEPRSKFGLADRKSEQKAQGKPQPEKNTEPLPVELWHKFIKGGKWGFNDGLKVVIPAMYDDIYHFKEGLASVEIDEKCGYIDAQNNIVIPLDYDDAMSFSEGFAMVVKNGKCGYINKNNEVVIDFEYDAATPFENGEAKVKKDGKWATLTADNQLTWI